MSELVPDWHRLTADETLAALETGADGLAEPAVSDRLARYGPNVFHVARPTSALRILAAQFRSVVVLLLFVAALLALAIGDGLEAAAIGIVLLINTIVGFITELSARRAMEGLLRLEVPRAVVIRGGEATEIDAREIVPGDIIQVEEGLAVPADARLLESAGLRTNESALSGESTPVDKRATGVFEENTPLPERANIVYRSTTVVAGNGRAAVVATGMDTEVGKIGRLTAETISEPTPLELRLNTLGRRLVWITLGLAALVVAVGALQGVALARMIETGVALAVAAIPEGLPAVATVALAVGMRRMARRRALIRRLAAVETLGSATVVCTDKTGTLTAGEMTLTTLALPEREVVITGIGLVPEGDFLEADKRLEPAEEPQLATALRITALANRAAFEESDGSWSGRGDPTEVALLVGARKAGMDPNELAAEWESVAEVPFSSERMLMASVRRSADRGTVVFVKGAPAEVLSRCARVLGRSGIHELADEERQALEGRNAQLAARGLRVLAIAERDLPDAWEAPLGEPDVAPEDALDGLTFVAFVGLIDPPAPGVVETLRKFRDAGVRIAMLTGDQRLTAEAIATDLDLLAEGQTTLDGRELHSLSSRQLAERISTVGAFSRVSPADKLKIVNAYRSNGEIVAMLGDGVNDAPALRKADIGVAMGIRGTDVAREAADVILQDDRFPTLGAAIAEGRVVFDNIRKFVFYLFSCNLAEVLVLLVASLAGLPLPLLPLQILWLNLVTDTFPALSLALEPAETGIMQRPPKDPQTAILSNRFMRAIAFYAGLITISTLLAYILRLDPASPERSTGIAFLTLGFAQIFHLGNARSLRAVVLPREAVRNGYAIGAVILSVGLQLLAVYYAPLSQVLALSPPRPGDWPLIVGLALAPAVIGQLIRLRRRPVTENSAASNDAIAV